MFNLITKLLAKKDDKVCLKLMAIIKKNNDAFHAIVNKKFFEGYTLLTYALAHKMKRCALALLKNGADPNKIGPNNKSVMELAFDDTDLVVAMLKCNLTVDITNVGDFLLMYNAEILSEIARSGFPLDAPVFIAGEELTPLAFFTKEEMPEMVDVLINIGVNLDTVDENGNTPANIAAQASSRFGPSGDIVDMLRENGADMTIANNDCEFPALFLMGI
jgi:ankyrin repeat protein